MPGAKVYSRHPDVVRRLEAAAGRDELAVQIVARRERCRAGRPWRVPAA